MKIYRTESGFSVLQRIEWQRSLKSHNPYTNIRCVYQVFVSFEAFEIIAKIELFLELRKNQINI